MKKLITKTLLLLFCLSLCCIKLMSQMAYFKGRVLEQGSGAAIKNANVSIINTDSNMVFITIRTNTNGEYQFNYKKLRTFRVEVTKTFFEGNSSLTLNVKDLISSRNNILPDILLKNSLIIPPKKIDTATTQKLVESKVIENRIYPNKDIYDLIYALNPRLDPSMPIPSNYPLVMPKFPEPERSIRKAFRKKHKREVKPSKEEAGKFIISSNIFGDLLIKFNGAGIRPGNALSPTDLASIKETLTRLDRQLHNYTTRAAKTSKATIQLINSEINLLSQLMKHSIANKLLSKENYKKCLNLAGNLQHFFQMLAVYELPDAGKINYYFVKLNNNSPVASGTEAIEKVVGQTAFPLGLLGAVYIDGINLQSSHFSKVFFYGVNDPRPFNIYVFVNYAGTNNPKPTPEEKVFDLTYYPPDLDELMEKPGNLPASTSTASIPPAKFVFIIEDVTNRTKLICEKFLDQETGKDHSVSWSLFRKRPYKLVFYLNICK